MGQLDAEPDAAGLSEAARLAGTIAADVVLCSPLRRASRTAAAVFPELAVTLDARLMERHLGAWQGRPKADVRAQQPEVFTENGTLDLSVTPPGGEPLEAMQARVLEVLHEIAALPADCRVAIVAHNGVLRIARVLLGLVTVAQASRMTEPFARPQLVSVDAAALAA